MVSLVAMYSSHDALINTPDSNAAAKKCKVDMKRIREWRKNKQSIAEPKEKHKGQGRKKINGGGGRAVDSDLDDIILEWIYGRRANGLRIS